MDILRAANGFTGDRGVVCVGKMKSCAWILVVWSAMRQARQTVLRQKDG